VLEMQSYPASQNDNIDDSQNCRHANPHVAPGKLSGRSLRLCSSWNVVLQPKQPALTTSGRRQGGLPQQLHSKWVQQTRYNRKQNGCEVRNEKAARDAQERYIRGA
jgi:hypothetical protein